MRERAEERDVLVEHGQVRWVGEAWPVIDFIPAKARGAACFHPVVRREEYQGGTRRRRGEASQGRVMEVESGR